MILSFSARASALRARERASGWDAARADAAGAVVLGPAGDGHGVIGPIVLGTDGAPPHAIVAHGMAHVPEGRQLFADLTVLDNLMLYAKDQSGERLRTLVAGRRAIAAQDAAR